MEYISTRGDAPVVDFGAALLAGLASDGGLYIPKSWPAVTSDEFQALIGKSYAEIAADILSRFTQGTFSKERLSELTTEIYAGFDDPAVAPLTKVGDRDWILELYHGPTLAFKDFAMQALGRLFDDELGRRGERLTIIAATSGDTGAAAIDALKGREHVDVFVLHPEGRVTDVQRRMMTSVDDPHVHNIAIDGSFDDCQAIVKALFGEREFVSQVSLGGVNSINWARIAAQTVYYFSTCAALHEQGVINFVVPTGNFGDVYAGYVAKSMGAPVGMLGVATNKNDILHRALTTGDYRPQSVSPSYSPSMDIQVASNFERLLFDVMDRNAPALSARMQAFKTDGGMMLSAEERAKISQTFLSYATSEEATLAEIKRHFEQTGDLIDPHTAVARCAALSFRERGAIDGPIVTLSTAHPAKFPDAVKTSTGTAPDLPSAHADLFDREERMMRAPASPDSVREIIVNHARAAH